MRQDEEGLSKLTKYLNTIIIYDFKSLDIAIIISKVQTDT